MRVLAATIVGLTAAIPTSAPAATIIVYADPMTLERRTVVVSLDGPDRAFYCMLPPAVGGCQQITVRRSRR